VSAPGKFFARLQEEQILTIHIEHVCLDSTTIKVHPDGTGALKITARKPSVVPGAAAPPKFIWLPRMLGVR
jgi:lactam utilization protein B